MKKNADNLWLQRTRTKLEVFFDVEYLAALIHTGFRIYPVRLHRFSGILIKLVLGGRQRVVSPSLSGPRF